MVDHQWVEAQMQFRVWGIRVQELGFGGLGIRDQGLGVQGLRFRGLGSKDMKILVDPRQTQPDTPKMIPQLNCLSVRNHGLRLACIIVVVWGSLVSTSLIRSYPAAATMALLDVTVLLGITRLEKKQNNLPQSLLVATTCHKKPLLERKLVHFDDLLSRPPCSCTNCWL